jgi:hypothetical protein
LKLHIANDGLVLFLENLRVDFIRSISVFVILLVLRHFVYKKQRKDFNTLGKQLPFPVKVRKDGLPNLNTAQLLLGNRTDDIARKQLFAFCEFNGGIAPVNPQNGIAVPVLGELAELSNRL